MGLKSVFDKIADTKSSSPPEGEEGCRTYVAPVSRLGQGAVNDDVSLGGRVGHDGPEV